MWVSDRFNCLMSFKIGHSVMENRGQQTELFGRNEHTPIEMFTMERCGVQTVSICLKLVYSCSGKSRLYAIFGCKKTQWFRFHRNYPKYEQMVTEMGNNIHFENRKLTEPMSNIANIQFEICSEWLSIRKLHYVFDKCVLINESLH